MISPMRILVRLVLKWKFSDTISRFCDTLSAIGSKNIQSGRNSSCFGYLGLCCVLGWVQLYCCVWCVDMAAASDVADQSLGMATRVCGGGRVPVCICVCLCLCLCVPACLRLRLHLRLCVLPPSQPLPLKIMHQSTPTFTRTRTHTQPLLHSHSTSLSLSCTPPSLFQSPPSPLKMCTQHK